MRIGMRMKPGVVAALVLLAAGPLGAQDAMAIKPGMTAAEVEAVWGKPASVAKAGDMTYLYYVNDCRQICGTDDVVFLERDQVVDAIVRDQNRRYDGVSSSPGDRLPQPTLPGPEASGTTPPEPTAVAPPAATEAAPREPNKP